MFTAILCLCAFLVPEAVCAAPDDDSAPSDTSLNKAFEELFSAKTAKDSINAYNDIGWYLYNNNDFHKSVEMFRSALNISVAAEDKKNMAVCCQNLGNALAMMNEFNEANEYNHKALNLYYELNNQEAISNVCKAIGIMCIQHHLYRTATGYLNRALGIDTIMSIRTGGNLTDDVAFDYLYLGYADINKYHDTRSVRTLQQAKSKNLKAYKMLSKTKNEIGMAYSSKNLMDIYLEIARNSTGQRQKSMLDSSLMYYNIGSKIMKELNLNSLSVDFMLWKAKYAIENHQFDQAWNLFGQIATSINDGTSDSYRVEYGYAMADYYEAIGYYRLAYEWLNRAARSEKRQLNREFAVKSAKMSVKNDFASILQQNEIDRENENIVRHEQEIRFRIITSAVILALVMIVILTIVIQGDLKRRKTVERQLMSSNEELESQKDQLEVINDQIASGINFAHHLQTSMLPTDEQMNALFDDTLILWRPLDIVSGDFYWVCRVGDRTLFSIADCTGHGVPGGFMSMLGISILSDITLMPEFKSGEMSAGNILDLMRDKVVESLRQSEESHMSLDGMDMAICIIDNKTLEMQYAGAFRPAIVISDGKMTEYKGDRMPISYISDNPRPFVTRKIALSKGDKVFIYSDGITDQFGYGQDGEEKKYTSRKLLALLKENCEKPFDELKKIINDSIDDWRAPANKKSIAQTDDIILLGVKI